MPSPSVKFALSSPGRYTAPTSPPERRNDHRTEMLLQTILRASGYVRAPNESSPASPEFPRETQAVRALVKFRTDRMPIVCSGTSPYPQACSCKSHRAPGLSTSCDEL